MTREHDDLDEYEGCCEGTGHAEGCEAREAAWDIADLICQSGCQGCCPAGHKPHGLQAMQDEAAQKAHKFFGRVRQ